MNPRPKNVHIKPLHAYPLDFYPNLSAHKRPALNPGFNVFFTFRPIKNSKGYLVCFITGYPNARESFGPVACVKVIKLKQLR